MFHKSIKKAYEGDRVALCVRDINAKKIERCVVCTPGSLSRSFGAIALVRKVRYFHQACKSSSKIHLTIGHNTTLATVFFFGRNELKQLAADTFGKKLPIFTFDTLNKFEFDEELFSGRKTLGGPILQLALFIFNQPLIFQKNAIVIGSKLDVNVHIKSCRIIFHGRICHQYTSTISKSDDLKVVQIFKRKKRIGSVDRVIDKTISADGKVYNVVGRGMFHSDSDLSRFIGKQIITKNKESGSIKSAFGRTGKFNIYFANGAKVGKGDMLILNYERFMFKSGLNKKNEETLI